MSKAQQWNVLGNIPAAREKELAKEPWKNASLEARCCLQKKMFQSLASGTIKCQADSHLWEKLFTASGGEKVRRNMAVV